MRKIQVKIQYISGEAKHIVQNAPNEMIQQAIEEMSAEWNDLTIIGERDGHHFLIHEIRTDKRCLTNDEITNMFYLAGCPECIDLRIE